MDVEVLHTGAQQEFVLGLPDTLARTDLAAPSTRGSDARYRLDLGLLRLVLAAIGVMWATAALAADAKTADAKTEKPGFAETVPPSLELGVGGRDASDVSEPEAGAEPGLVKPAQTGAAPSTNTADPDIDIAEVGRLMNAQSGGGDAQAPGTPRTAPGSDDIGPVAHALQGLVALCVVLMLIVLVAYGLRKYGRRTPLLTVLAGSSLATVLGKVHLARGVSLHFLQTGGRVLVVGVTPTKVSLVAEFDEAAFEIAKEDVAAPKETKTKANFLEHLIASKRNMDKPQSIEATDDADITQLRGDIERLQRHLRDLSSETRD